MFTMSVHVEPPQQESSTDLIVADPARDILLDAAHAPDLYTERWLVPLGGE